MGHQIHLEGRSDDASKNSDSNDENKDEGRHHIEIKKLLIQVVGKKMTDEEALDLMFNCPFDFPEYDSDDMFDMNNALGQSN